MISMISALLILQFAKSHAEPPLLLGSSTSCAADSVIRSILVPQVVVDQKLSNVPYLRDWINSIIQDPKIPKNIKRVISRGLNADLSVIELTEAVRAEYGLLSTTGASYAGRDGSFKLMKTQHPLNYNEKLSQSSNRAKVPLLTKHRILVQVRPFSKTSNDLITLVHELSHIKFVEFLEEYLPLLVKKFPPELVRPLADGTFEIHPDLLSFLAERYAFETEYDLLKSTHGRYFKSWYSPNNRYSWGPGLLSDKEMKEFISDQIIEIYEIRDPRILKLRTQSISEILLGGGKPKAP